MSAAATVEAMFSVLERDEWPPAVRVALRLTERGLARTRGRVKGRVARGWAGIRLAGQASFIGAGDA